ncbi:putative coil containing protein [Vibrio phage 277E43-1]|nr:putative coil containing protein [Vibrio phage 277E43-1]
MITCKEDLYGTEFIIESKDEAILLEAKCIELGIKKAGWSGCNYKDGVMFGLISKDLNTPHSKKLLFTRRDEGGDTMDEFLNLKRLPLEDLKPQTKEVEWVNGLPPVGAGCEAVFIEHEPKGYGEFLVLGYHSNYVWLEYIGELSNKSKHYTAEVDSVKFRKPETPEQKLARERIENGKAFYELMSEIETSVMHPSKHGKPNDWEEMREEWQQVYILQAEKLNYKAK